MSAPSVMCCGEAVTDRVVSGDEIRSDFAGGGAVNSAVALCRLGTPAGFLGALSTDPDGARIAAHLRREGVDMTHTARRPEPSTIATIRHGAHGPSFSFRDIDSAAQQLSVQDIAPLPVSVLALLFGGISLIGNGCGGAFENVMARAASTHLIYLDLNIRPDLISDPDPYFARLARMAAQADILKASDEDLTAFDPIPHLPRPALFLHSKGPEGVIAHKGGASQHVPAPKVAVTDSLGAGDVFNAAFLSELSHRGALGKASVADMGLDALRPVLEFAVVAASLSVTRPGAAAPTRKDVLCAL